MAYRDQPIPVSDGGTGATTLTNHGVLVGAGTSAISALSVGATGTVLIGNTGANPSFSAAPTVTSISFGGTPLSNYTEGSVALPTFDGAVSGTTTYTSRVIYYTRVGNIVMLYGQIVITNATGTGDAIIGGLPFTVKSQANGDSVGSCGFNGSLWAWPTLTTSLSVQFINNTTTAKIAVSGSSAASGFMQMSNAALTLLFSGFYQI